MDNLKNQNSRALKHVAYEDAEQKALEEISSFLVHKLRNPLGGIKGFAALLERDLKNEPDLQKMASMIVKGADHLNAILSVILEYTHPLKLKSEETDLTTLIREETSCHHIRFSPSIDPLFAFIDNNQIRKALSHLIKYAKESMHNEGKISVTLDASENTATLSVNDEGIGIPEERLDKVFSPFFTAPSGGLEGVLAEVKKIVRAHSGSIEVISKEGEGSTFIIKLPIKRGSQCQ